MCATVQPSNAVHEPSRTDANQASKLYKDGVIWTA
jgi:hypothetical protein